MTDRIVDLLSGSLYGDRPTKHEFVFKQKEEVMKKWRVKFVVDAVVEVEAETIELASLYAYNKPIAELIFGDRDYQEAEEI